METSVRQGIPTDLEERLQQAWLRSQLNLTSKNLVTNKAPRENNALPAPQRVSKDLTNTLQQLWTKTQKSDSEVSAGSIQLSAESASSGIGRTSYKEMAEQAGLEEWLSNVQAVEPVPYDIDYMDEDFFSGLDELNVAFAELENMLPLEQFQGDTNMPNEWDTDIEIDDYLVDNGHNENDSLAFAQQKKDNGTSLPPLQELGSSLDDSGGQIHSEDSDRMVLPSQKLSSQGFLKENPIDLLVSIANAVVSGNMELVYKELSLLGDIASVYGDAKQRLSAYFLEGLVARISGGRAGKVYTSYVENEDPDCGKSLSKVFEVLVNASPYHTFGHVACNSAMLEAFEGAERVHIIDYGLGYGLQWPPLIQALSVRPGGPPHLHITGVDLWAPPGIKRAHCILEAGQRLAAVARAWNVPFEYEALRTKLEAVQPHEINIREGEVVAVNCALRLHNLLDETVTPSNPRNAVLRTIHALNPRIVTIVEQNTNQSSPFFLARFYEALHYYTTMFDSIESSLPVDSKERRLFEQHVLGRAILNVLSAEGRDRVERQEALGQWQARVRRAGFKPSHLTTNVVKTVKALLRTYGEGYAMVQVDEGSLVLNWKERPLLAMSAWRPESGK